MKSMKDMKSSIIMIWNTQNTDLYTLLHALHVLHGNIMLLRMLDDGAFSFFLSMKFTVLLHFKTRNNSVL